MSLLQAHFPEAQIPASVPHGEKGAYLLLVRLDRELPIYLRQQRFVLDAGCYAYAGSANGPGGIKARIARHLLREKKVHWHVDQLTIAASSVDAMAFPDGNECALVNQLRLQAGTLFPVPGFGSSDCRTCVSHLLFLAHDH